MAKNEDKELEENVEEQKEDKELEENVEEQKEETSTSNIDFKTIVINECSRIYDAYIQEQTKLNTDTYFIQSLSKEGKTKDSCINHIMNELTKKRIYGGADTIMWEYINEYYVDDIFTEVKDEWSSRLRSAGSNSTAPRKLSDKEIAIRYAEIPNEVKNEMYQKALEEAERSAKRKAEEDFKKKEEKRKAKEKELAEKKKLEEQAKKEAELKAIEEAKANKPTQIDLFDFLGK